MVGRHKLNEDSVCIDKKLCKAKKVLEQEIESSNILDSLRNGIKEREDRPKWPNKRTVSFFHN